MGPTFYASVNRRYDGSAVFSTFSLVLCRFAGLSVVPISSVAGVQEPNTCRPQRLLSLWPYDDDDDNDEYSGT
jgi:hypothetical protein